MFFQSWFLGHVPNDKPTIEENEFSKFERLSSTTTSTTLENNKTNETSEIILLSNSFNFNFS